MLLSHPQRGSDGSDTLKCTYFFTGSHKIYRLGGDFVVDKVLGEFLRVFIPQAGGSVEHCACAVPRRASLG